MNIEASSKLDKIIRLSDESRLLPGDLELQRQNHYIFDSLRIPAHPLARKETNLQGRPGDFRYFQEVTGDQTLATVVSSSGETVAFMDKLYPHALYEVMFISQTPEVTPSIFDLSSEIGERLFATMADFARYANEWSLIPHISWSYDPDTGTGDRESGQGVKWHHTHMVGRTKEEIDQVTSSRQKLSGVHAIRQRRLVDESSIVLSLLLTDIVKNQTNLGNYSGVNAPFSTNNPLPVMALNLDSGWETLKDKRFFDCMKQVHELIENTYANIAGIISDGYVPNRDWLNQSDRAFMRPKLNLTESNLVKLREYLTDRKVSTENVEIFINFLSRLKPKLFKDFSRCDLGNIDGDILTYLFPLAGPCYSTAITEVDGSVNYIVRPYMFSDLGGAGIAYLQNTTVKTKKGVGVFTNSELEDRRNFQLRYMNELFQS